VQCNRCARSPHLFTTKKQENIKNKKTVSMNKCELRKEPYEVPRIDCVQTEVETGFAGSKFTPGSGEEEDWEW
jgi:hypothetical protein